MVSVEVVGHPPISTPRQILMNVYWFSINMMWASLFLIIMPYHIQALAGIADKGKLLALVVSMGGIVSILAAPLFRALSDHSFLPGGRRKPWVVIGSLAVMFALAVLSASTKLTTMASLPGWIVAFLMLQIFSNAASAPCGALISAQLSTQRVSAVDWQGLMTMIGIFAGAATGFLIAPLGVPAVFNILIIVVFIGTLLTVFYTSDAVFLPDVPQLVLPEFLQSIYLPFKNKDFTMMFLNRLLIGMGLFTIQEFIFYYMTDAFMAPYTLPILGQVTRKPEGAASVFFVAVFLGAIVASLLAGFFSDASKRKTILYATSLMFGLTCMVFTFTRSFSFSIFMGLIFGIGYGAYDRLAWRMVSDILPSVRNYGKNMGIWHIAVVLPQVIATPIGGFLLDYFQKVGLQKQVHHMGYIVIFVVAVIYFVLGSIVLRKIKGIHG